MILCFEAFASFHSGSLSLWAYCCHSYPRGNFSSFRGDVSEAPEREKEKKSHSSERDRPVPAKVQKLGVPPTSLVQEPEWASSPLDEVPLVLYSPPSSNPVA